MPSFDIVSEINWQEVKNAVQQANKEISTRFDFKGSEARIEEMDPTLKLFGDDDFKLRQILDILQLKLSKREVDMGALQIGEVKKSSMGKVVQEITVRQGIDAELARKMVKLVKSQKFKVQVSIQGDQLRVSGKKRDDLQQCIAFVKEQNLGLPLQYSNFRD